MAAEEQNLKVAQWRSALNSNSKHPGPTGISKPQRKPARTLAEEEEAFRGGRQALQSGEEHRCIHTPL